MPPRAPAVILVAALGLVGCATGGGGCDVAYPEPDASPYALPWSVGETYRVVNANCGRGPTHNGPARFSYDFAMPVGTVIRASRAGLVIAVVDGFDDFNRTPGEENRVFILHADGTVARYYHLTRDGSSARVGSRVGAADPIGRSGATGYIGAMGIPHLHFDVVAQECGTEFFGPLCETVPITFRDAGPHAGGLLDGASYTALGPGP